VKTRSYNLFTLQRETRDVLRRLAAEEPPAAPDETYLRTWYAPRAAAELAAFRGLLAEYESSHVFRVVLARAARSARLTTHFDLDFPRTPQRGSYWCHKHRRECRPVERAAHFVERYALDTVERIKAFSRVRARAREALVLHGDARMLDFGGRFDGILTSPPYPGLIDYHEQHRYAYELLGLEQLRELEVGSPVGGTGRAALDLYSEGIVATLTNAAAQCRSGAPVLIVVNDRRGLYPAILERAGLELERRLRRHVNRRTGRRAGEFFEDVLVARVG
jgi:hypothetical protein